MCIVAVRVAFSFSLQRREETSSTAFIFILFYFFVAGRLVVLLHVLVLRQCYYHFGTVLLYSNHGSCGRPRIRKVRDRTWSVPVFFIFISRLFPMVRFHVPWF